MGLFIFFYLLQSLEPSNHKYYYWLQEGKRCNKLNGQFQCLYIRFSNIFTLLNNRIFTSGVLIATQQFRTKCESDICRLLFIGGCFIYFKHFSLLDFSSWFAESGCTMTWLSCPSSGRSQEQEKVRLKNQRLIQIMSRVKSLHHVSFTVLC